MPLIVLSTNLTLPIFFTCHILCRQAQPLLLSAKVTQKHFRQATLYQKCLCALPGGIATLTLANNFAFSSTRFIHAKAHLNQVRNNAKSIYFATLQYSSPQNLYSLHCCVLPFILALPCPIPNTKNCLFSSPECQTPFLHFPMSSLKFPARPPYQKSHCSELYQKSKPVP